MKDGLRLLETRHFNLSQAADGVYAAIHRDGGWAIGNAGIVDLGGETVIFDTFMTPVAAEALREAAEQLTQQPVTYVVNSHYHNDHIWGNQVFQDATLITTSLTRDLILTKGQEEYDWYRDNSAAQLRRFSDQIEAEEDEGKRAKILI
jgi:glyoxylase-like metal-dependent hydrolase (beta-lactamase superfamily II)